MIKCIDISENRKLSSVSPIAIMVWVAVFTVLTAVMEPGIIYILLLILSYIITQVLFQYTTRNVYWFLKFLFTNRYLTPSFRDPKYLADHKSNVHLQRILPLENSVKMGDGLEF
jgi:hypothetical protein